MLELRNVSTRYGQIQVLYHINLKVAKGELVCLLGGNASGKSTTIKTILGILKPFEGEVLWEGERIDPLTPSEISKRGIVPVLEGRRIFPGLTVEENLLLGAYLRKDYAGIRSDLERMYTLFPRLKERRTQMGGTLSGGEQQMLALARALMARPRLLLMDEPSMGLAPNLVQQNFELISQIHKEGIGILVVEQNAHMALSIASRGYVLQVGEIVLEGSSEFLRNNPAMRKAYLNIAEENETPESEVKR